MHRKELEFHFRSLPGRVIFGNGTLMELANEMDMLGARRAFVVTTPGRSAATRQLEGRFPGRIADIYAGAVMHTPVETTADAERALAASGADILVSIGGGSAIGLGKALALRTDLPQIAIPTTYAGSEATPVLGQSQDGVKTTMQSPKVLPETIIYDVALSSALPARIGVTSAINAIAHAVEALYARDRNPVTSLMAEEAIRRIARAMPVLATGGADADARSDALYGAWLCGICLASVGMALHHKLCHTLGGSFGLPHADVHTVLLPHAVAYNSAAEPEAMARIARALGSDDAAGGLFDLAARHGGPTSLREIGLDAAGIDRAVEIALTNPYWNPEPLTRDGLLALLRDAHAGTRPACRPGR